MSDDDDMRIMMVMMMKTSAWKTAFVNQVPDLVTFFYIFRDIFTGFGISTDACLSKNCQNITRKCTLDPPE